MKPRERVPDDGRVLLRLGRPSPRLPPRSLSLQARVTVAALVHGAVAALLLATFPHPAVTQALDHWQAIPVRGSPPRMVFVAPLTREAGGGGGGGGNRRRGPIPRAQAPGRDALTMPVARSRTAGPNPRDIQPPVQEVVLDARPLASGTSFLAGLPDAGPSFSSDARGPGGGAGFGEGEGSGVGSGRGPGVGPGTGGGLGGGVYRPGGAVTPPFPLTRAQPTYSLDALRMRIQGSVLLELIVRRDGMPDAIRVLRSLEPGGLDEEAIAAVRQWRFRPGRIGDEPVDVLVTVLVDFHIH